MCGIFAMVSNKQGGFWRADLEMFEQGLLVDSLRGPDSTGAFCVHRDGKVSGIKHASHPYHTFRSNAWKDFTSEAVSFGRILVGHNRKATHGSINNNNSHPFFEKHIVLVHNGTLHNHKNDLAEREVDSHAMAVALAEATPEEVPQLIADVSGAYAFVWWDMNQEKLFFIRNSQRPLNIVKTREMTFLCSEAWMARGILFRNQRSLKAEDVQVFDVKEGVIFSMDLKGNVEEITLPKKAQSTTQGPVVQTQGQHRGTTTQTPNIGNVSVERPTTSTNSGLVLPFDRKTSEPFRRGEKIVVAIHAATAMDLPTGTRVLRVTGQVAHVGKPKWDFMGLLPRDVDIGDIQDWIGHRVEGRVMEINPHLAAGPSLKLIDFRHISRELILSWNKQPLTMTEWKTVENHHRCVHCNASIQEFDYRFTNVRVDKHTEAIEVTCGDCVEERIANSEIKDQFIAARYAALDSWIPDSEKRV